MAKGEIGVTGLNTFGGSISDEFLRELRGKEGYKRYNEMRRNSPVVGAMLYYHEQAIRKVSWNFANKANAKAKDERVDFLNYARDRMTQSWNDAISEWLSFLPFGYSLSYPLYKRDNNKRLIWDAFSPRRQDTVYEWILNYPGVKGYDPAKRNGEILGFVQQAAPTYEMYNIPIDRVLHFRTRVEANNPEGMSLLRNAWIPYYFTKNLQTLEAIGFERDTNGMPVIVMGQGSTTDPDDSNSDFSKAAETVRNIRTDEQAGLVVPFGWEVSLLSGAGKSFADLGAAIGRYESRTLMAMLSQFIMLGQNSVGSLALSNDQSSIAEMVVNATADIIAETFTKQEIPRILKLNGWVADDIVLEHTLAGDTDISVLADFLQKVSDKLTWDASDELWLRQIGGLPEKDEATIQNALEEKQRNAELIHQQLAQSMNKSRQDNNNDPSHPEDHPTDQAQMEAELFGVGSPLDERQRRKAEKAWNEAMTAFLEKQQRRVMKAAKEMRNANPV